MSRIFKMELMSRAMWTVFKPDFEKQLVLFGVTDTKPVMRRAAEKYKEIINGIEPFGKNDMLLINILSAATFAAVYMSLEIKPTLETAERYYDAAMSGNSVMRIFLKCSNYYSEGYQKKLARQAELSRSSQNPYSWKFTFTPGATLDSFYAEFNRCGICTLFKNLGIYEVTPALCAYDYGMAKLTNTVFTRDYTIASGAEICDCHYNKRK